MGKVLLPVCWLLLLAQGLWFYPRMPAVMATHFGGAGRPNGWMSVPVAIGFELFIVGVMSLAFFGLPKVLRKLSPALINIPNRTYWLAPERVDASVAVLERYMNGFGAVVLLFIAAIHQLVFHVNLAPTPHLPTGLFLAVVGSFLGAMLVWIGLLLRRFGRIPG